jgi:hypothetical protein
MMTGRQALVTIENAIVQARNAENRLDAALRSASEEAARRRADRTALFKELARTRLDLMAREPVQQALDAAERRALDLIQRGGMRRDQRQRERAAAFAQVQKAEALRHQRAEALEGALGALDKMRAMVAPKVQASAAYRAQLEAIAEAERIATEADKKALQSEQDLAEKRTPYEADPLFMYLWRRKFGTAEYSAGHLTRFLDRKVANLVGYIGARANFAMLQEIPARLRAHATQRVTALEGERAKLAAAEMEGMREAGAAPMVDAVEKARAALIEAEQALSTERARLAQIDQAAADDRDDPDYNRAIELLAEADSRQDLRELYQEAAATRSPSDEAVVRRIEQNDIAIARAEQEVQGIRNEARELARRRSEIERERDTFRQRGYDRPYGGFSNDGLIGEVLKGILQGALQGAVLRDVLRDGYRQGGGGFGGGSVIFPPTTGGSWGNDAAGGGWVPPWLDGGSGGPWSGGGSSDSGGRRDEFTTGGSF